MSARQHFLPHPETVRASPSAEGTAPCRDEAVRVAGDMSLPRAGQLEIGCVRVASSTALGTASNMLKPSATRGAPQDPTGPARAPFVIGNFPRCSQKTWIPRSPPEGCTVVTTNSERKRESRESKGV